MLVSLNMIFPDPFADVLWEVFIVETTHFPDYHAIFLLTISGRLTHQICYHPLQLRFCLYHSSPQYWYSGNIQDLCHHNHIIPRKPIISSAIGEGEEICRQLVIVDTVFTIEILTIDNLIFRDLALYLPQETISVPQIP